MKLFGSSRNSKHAVGHAKSNNSNNRNVKKAHKKRHPLRTIIIIIFILAAIAAGLFAWWEIYVKPPEVNPSKTPVKGENTDISKPDNIADPEQDTPVEERQGEKFTFVIMGTDAISGNTDTIMVAMLDTVDYKLNVVSIPRDTLVNVSWSAKKVNTLYSVGGSEEVIEGLSKVLGYELDFYAVINLDAFVKLIDAIGGVYYDVPQNMNYDDDEQNLHIHVNKGEQLLDGETAVEVMRFRKGYSNADIGRIETQQGFLMAAAKQLLANVDNIPLTTLADIFVNDVKTDLAYGNIIWFAKELMKMDVENISFNTLPGKYDDYINGASYVTIYVDEWLEMINTYLNPFDEDIELSDLSILTRDSSGRIYSTDGVYEGRASWGN